MYLRWIRKGDSSLVGDETGVQSVYSMLLFFSSGGAPHLPAE